MKPDELIEIRTKYGRACLCRYYDNPEHIILTSLCVRKNRRKNHGVRLISKAERIARSIGGTHIWLQFDPNGWQEQCCKELGYSTSNNDTKNDILKWLKTKERRMTFKTAS